MAEREEMAEVKSRGQSEDEHAAGLRPAPELGQPLSLLPQWPRLCRQPAHTSVGGGDSVCRPGFGESALQCRAAPLPAED